MTHTDISIFKKGKGKINNMHRSEIVEALKKLETRFTHTKLYFELYSNEMRAVSEAIKLLDDRSSAENTKKLTNKYAKIIVTEMPKTPYDCIFSITYQTESNTGEVYMPNCKFKAEKLKIDGHRQFTCGPSDITCDTETCPYLKKIETYLY